MNVEDFGLVFELNQKNLKVLKGSHYIMPYFLLERSDHIRKLYGFLRN